MLKYPKLMIFLCLSYRFPSALTHSWRFFDAPTLFLFFLFLDKIYIILSTTVGNKWQRDSRREVHHHAGGDYNFLTQKKKTFLKVNSSPPTLCSMSWIQQCTYGYVQYTYDNFNIKKNFVFRSWQLTMTTC
jgi:hypothetical protein